MALFYGCMEKCCRNMLDTAGIVRDACFRQPPPQPGSNGRNKLANEKGNSSLGRAEAPAPISFCLLVMSISKQMTLKTMQFASQHLFSGVPSQ